MGTGQRRQAGRGEPAPGEITTKPPDLLQEPQVTSCWLLTLQMLRPQARKASRRSSGIPPERLRHFFHGEVIPDRDVRRRCEGLGGRGVQGLQCGLNIIRRGEWFCSHLKAFAIQCRGLDGFQVWWQWFCFFSGVCSVPWGRSAVLANPSGGSKSWLARWARFRAALDVKPTPGGFRKRSCPTLGVFASPLRGFHRFHPSLEGFAMPWGGWEGY